jgi:hypothetical protein
MQSKLNKDSSYCIVRTVILLRSPWQIAEYERRKYARTFGDIHIMPSLFNYSEKESILGVECMFNFSMLLLLQTIFFPVHV